MLSQKTLQTLSAMKQQLLELLSDLGFVTEGLTARRLSRMARNGADAVKKATGDDLNSNGNNYKVNK
jgi:ATP-dependent RNA helicase DHX57